LMTMPRVAILDHALTLTPLALIFHAESSQIPRKISIPI
jgi:hypothetical protein